MVLGGAHFFIIRLNYNLIHLCCLFDKRPKLYDDFSCTLKTTKPTLHSNLTTLCIVSYVTSQRRHCLLPSTFPRSFDVAMFIIRHSSKWVWLKADHFIEV